MLVALRASLSSINQRLIRRISINQNCFARKNSPKDSRGAKLNAFNAQCVCWHNPVTFDKPDKTETERRRERYCLCVWSYLAPATGDKNQWISHIKQLDNRLTSFENHFMFETFPNWSLNALIMQSSWLLLIAAFHNLCHTFVFK